MDRALENFVNNVNYYSIRLILTAGSRYEITCPVKQPGFRKIKKCPVI